MTIYLSNGYTIVTKTKETGDNYTLFASVYKKGDKTPLFGTSFKTGTTAETIRNWGQMKVNSLSNPLTELFSHFNI